MPIRTHDEDRVVSSGRCRQPIPFQWPGDSFSVRHSSSVGPGMGPKSIAQLGLGQFLRGYQGVSARKLLLVTACHPHASQKPGGCAFVYF